MNQKELSDIVKVLEFRSAEDLNNYLDLGWMIIGTKSEQHSANGFSLTYCVGWSKKLGEVKVPNKTAQEKALDSWANENN
ncbi:MAG: hypothetical protein COA59_17495 [Colwellia sp.]|jgi:hypothetical protein|nr:MAG: hypothetical protein COA59_17495 [Colwellia sp.]